MCPVKILFIFLFFVAPTVLASKMSTRDIWETVSEYALGVWKYYNNTVVLQTIPHS